MHNAKLLGLVVVANLALIEGCSKYPVDAGVEAVQSAAKQLLTPPNPKDASSQAERMVSLLADRSDDGDTIEIRQIFGPEDFKK